MKFTPTIIALIGVATATDSSQVAHKLAQQIASDKSFQETLAGLIEKDLDVSTVPAGSFQDLSIMDKLKSIASDLKQKPEQVEALLKSYKADDKIFSGTFNSPAGDLTVTETDGSITFKVNHVEPVVPMAAAQPTPVITEEKPVAVQTTPVTGWTMDG